MAVKATERVCIVDDSDVLALMECEESAGKANGPPTWTLKRNSCRRAILKTNRPRCRRRRLATQSILDDLPTNRFAGARWRFSGFVVSLVWGLFFRH